MANILIVEDNDEYRDLLVRELRSFNHNVTEAHDGKEAIKMVKKDREFDLIILDILLPEMDGVMLYYHLRDVMKSNAPVLILTNVPNAADDLDTEYVLYKGDVTMEEVRDRVTSILAIENATS